MRVTFGSHNLEITSWETKREMLNFIEKCDAGSLLLGKEAEQEIEFYSVIIHLEWSGVHRFGIGICSEGHGLSPHLFLLPKSEILLFGLNKEVSAIDLNNREVYFRIKLDSLFRSFLPLSQESIILIFHEIGVIAISEEGDKLWKYERDIIANAYIKKDNLYLEFLDDSPVGLSLSSGGILENSKLSYGSK